MIKSSTSKRKSETQRADQPNKKHYDPRKWLRLGEQTFKQRLIKAFEDLNNINTLA